ncbi:hypothetical protein [Mesorhizobium sp. M2A.F.Ca.ET.039.01.1.1]|uniref:hypothetical protein n=1 Tax=Mesorhizobium sp. M2A.F.Ca.ET.039.01.1.1 TaxID=2496746 RepID=UPI000FCB4692|nr:hypothetical protein [Mesorhizobium sp. M2A.F.Ca.ET.039.01.1.1]RWX72612.1 hypothetical protein EOA24_00060 [Mesorhizobium sp. M2A.F.Ca.ET.039.01.1.1]
MRQVLDRLFGRGATLKRETIVFCWAWMTFIIIRVFAYTPAEHVEGYVGLISGVFWPIVALLAAIFGIQLAPNLGGRSETTTTMQTPEATIETKTTTAPAAADPDARPPE